MFTFKDVEDFYKNALEQNASTREVKSWFGKLPTHENVFHFIMDTIEHHPDDWDSITAIFLHALMRSKDISDEQNGEKQKELH